MKTYNNIVDAEHGVMVILEISVAESFIYHYLLLIEYKHIQPHQPDSIGTQLVVNVIWLII